MSRRLLVLLGVVGLVASLAALRKAVQERPASPWKAPASDSYATAAERGRQLYADYGCAMCHGADGKGGFANPNSETEGKVPGVIYVAEGYTKRELRQKVLDGTVTVGKEDAAGPVPPYRMPGWRGHLTAQEVDDLVEYLVSLYPKSEEEKWR